jgi:hypothetical protein
MTGENQYSVQDTNYLHNSCKWFDTFRWGVLKLYCNNKLECFWQYRFLSITAISTKVKPKNHPRGLWIKQATLFDALTS